jgi:hypothetical protein
MTAPLQRQAFERVAAFPMLGRMLTAFQTGVLESFAIPFALPFIRGVEVQAGAQSDPSGGTFAVLHRLKRAPRGYLVLDVVRAAGDTGDLSIYRRSGDERSDSRLVLYASTSFESLTLWVW